MKLKPFTNDFEHMKKKSRCEIKISHNIVSSFSEDYLRENTESIMGDSGN